MPRSHPPTLTTLAYRTVKDETLFGRDDVVLCACSGGPDSTALLHALSTLRRRIGHRVFAVGIDHGLRAGALAELELASTLARRLEVPFEVRAVSLESGGNLMARAREARHRALQAEAARVGATRIALGHTADDRAETWLMRLLRGAGPRGLAVMPARAPSPFGPVELVRPLIGVRRAAVLLHLERHELASASDPTNSEVRFLRSRIRAELLPMLESLSPGTTDHLCHLADMFREYEPGALDGLGRAQQSAVRRARRAGDRAITVRVSGGRDITLKFSEKNPVLSDEP